MSENIGRYNVIFEILTKQQGDIDEVKKKATGLQGAFNLAKSAFAGILAGAAVQQTIGKIFEITKKYQQYNTILKVATGSQQEATKSMSLIEDTAKDTVFSVDELTSSYIKFANRGIRPTRDEIIGLADLAASQGKSFEQLVEASLDAQSNEYERLKEFGIRVTKVGNNVNLAFKGVNKEVANTPEAINKAIVELGKLDGVAGSNLKQMKDLSGVISNIGDNSERFWKNIGDRMKGFFTESLGAVAKFVEKLVEFTTVPVSEKLREEQTELNVLVQSITDTNVSQERRNALITELQEKYPFFLKNIDAETASNDQLKARLKEVNELYIKRIALQGQTEKIDKALKLSGDAKLKQLDIERERRTDLNKIVSQFKLPVDLNSIDGLDKQTSAVLDNLKKLFSFRTSERTGENIINGNRQAYDSYQKLVGGFINASGAAKIYAKSLTEVEEQQQALKDFEKSLGTDLEAINKLFDVDPKAKDPNKKPTVKGKTNDKAVKDTEQKALETNLEFAEKNFALRERTARETIKDAEELSIALQRIELEKQIALLSIRQDYEKSNERIAFERIKDPVKKAEIEPKVAKFDNSEFIKLGNQINDLTLQYDKLSGRKIDIIDILPPKQKEIVIKNAKELETALASLSAQILSTVDPNVKEQLKAQYDQIAQSIASIGSPKLNKIPFEAGGFEEIDLSKLLPEDRVPALQGRLNSVASSIEGFKETIQAGLADPLDLQAFDSLQEEGEKIIELLERLGIEIPKKSKKIIKGTEDVLGISPETIKLIGQSVEVAKDAFTTVSDIYIGELDKRIAAQESRVEDANKVAEKGNVKQLQIEEARLQELIDKREQAAKRQEIIEKAAAQAQIIVNTLLTISNLQVAAAKTAGASGPAAPFTVPIVLAIVGGLIASAASLFQPPKFKDGIPVFSTKKDGRVTGPGNGRSDSVPAMLSNGERVVDAINNSKIGNMPNAELAEAVQLYKAYPKLKNPIIVAGQNKMDISELKEGMAELQKSFEGLKIVTKLDANGFSQAIERRVDKVIRRNKIKG